jgi:hypothetical protein
MRMMRRAGETAIGRRPKGTGRVKTTVDPLTRALQSFRAFIQAAIDKKTKKEVLTGMYNRLKGKAKTMANRFRFGKALHSGSNRHLAG